MTSFTLDKGPGVACSRFAQRTAWLRLCTRIPTLIQSCGYSFPRAHVSRYRRADALSRHVGRVGSPAVCFSGEQRQPSVPGVGMIKELPLPWAAILPAAEPTIPAPADAEERELLAYWLSCGVSGPDQLQRHLLLARKNPRLRNLTYVRQRMRVWDAALAEFPGVDANRVVRDDEYVMERLPVIWVRRVRALQEKHPGVAWDKVLEECPALGFLPAGRMAAALQDWAERWVGVLSKD